MVCRDGIATCMHLCVPLVANSLTCYWLNVHVMFVCVDITYVWMYICLCLGVPVSPNPPFQNIVRHGFCVMLSDDPAFLAVYT